jgi:acetyl esterase/lipase
MAGAFDSEIAAWLDAYPAPDIDYRDVAAVRALTARYMSEQGGPAPRWPRADVRMDAIRIGGFDALLWRPRDRHDALPVVLAFHGGAFIVGGPLGAERIAVPLAAEHAIATVSLAYPLAPEHRAPAARDAARAALAALGDIRGLDPERVAVHGSSAGASLAAGLALHARDEGRHLALQSLTCPALDSRAPLTDDPRHSVHGVSPTLTRESVIAMWEHYLGDARADSPELSGVVPALAHDLRGVAPAHVTVAEYDVLRDEALEYARRLAESGVTVEVDLVPGTVHGFDGLLPESQVARSSIDRQVEALALALNA